MNTKDNHTPSASGRTRTDPVQPIESGLEFGAPCCTVDRAHHPLTPPTAAMLHMAIRYASPSPASSRIVACTSGGRSVDQTTHQLLTKIAASSVISADDAARLVAAPQSSVYTAIDRLVDAGILTALTNRKRDQIWGAIDILDELEDLSTRIGIAAR